MRPFRLALLLSFCCALCLSPATWAGSYTGPDCTGGIIKSGGSKIGDYATSSQDGSYGRNPYAGDNFDASGQIKATFTWVPGYTGEPIPKSVVVKETCNVSAEASASNGYPGAGSPSTSAHADNGLGDPEIPGGTPPTSATASSTGTRYQVVTPLANGNIELTLSPAANAAATAGYQRSASLSVKYWAVPYVVTVDLPGSTIDANHAHNILIGQRCQGRLNCAVGSFDNYNWSVPGEKFGSFVVALGGAATAVVNSPEDLDPLVWTRDSPKWYWKKNETVTVSCTARITIGSFTGTATGERQIEIWAPHYSFRHNLGSVTIINRVLISGADSTSAEGSYWVGKVFTPGLFSNAQGFGQWHFVQKIVPARWYTDSAGDPWRWSINGLPGLDSTYPYEPGPTDPPDPNSLPGPWLGDDSAHGTGDSPSITLQDSNKSWRINETFQVFMMYLPPVAPGSDSQWVPLHRFAWGWSVNVTRPGTSWLNWPPGDSAGTITMTFSERWTQHPTWTRRLVAGAPFERGE